MQNETNQTFTTHHVDNTCCSTKLSRVVHAAKSVGLIWTGFHSFRNSRGLAKSGSFVVVGVVTAVGRDGVGDGTGKEMLKAVDESATPLSVVGEEAFVALSEYLEKNEYVRRKIQSTKSIHQSINQPDVWIMKRNQKQLYKLQLLQCPIPHFISPKSIKGF